MKLKMKKEFGGFSLDGRMFMYLNSVEIPLNKPSSRITYGMKYRVPMFENSSSTPMINSVNFVFIKE